MTLPQKDLRYEIKYVTLPEEIHEVRQMIRLLPFCFKTAYPSRQINNIYFDTYDRTNYEDNLSGFSRRRKVRYRWYGQAHPGETNGQLELKAKDSQLGWKIIKKIESNPFLKKDCLWYDVVSSLKEQIDEKLLLHFQFSDIPASVNHYKREYYVSHDQKVRITVDTNLRYYFDGLERPRFNFDVAEQNMHVIEVKAKLEDIKFLEKVLNRIPLIQQKHSKYVYGLFHSV